VAAENHDAKAAVADGVGVEPALGGAVEPEDIGAAQGIAIHWKFLNAAYLFEFRAHS